MRASKCQALGIINQSLLMFSTLFDYNYFIKVRSQMMLMSTFISVLKSIFNIESVVMLMLIGYRTQYLCFYYFRKCKLLCYR